MPVGVPATKAVTRSATLRAAESAQQSALRAMQSVQDQVWQGAGFPHLPLDFSRLEELTLANMVRSTDYLQEQHDAVTRAILNHHRGFDAQIIQAVLGSPDGSVFVSDGYGSKAGTRYFIKPQFNTPEVRDLLLQLNSCGENFDVTAAAGTVQAAPHPEGERGMSRHWPRWYYGLRHGVLGRG